MTYWYSFVLCYVINIGCKSRASLFFINHFVCYLFVIQLFTKIISIGWTREIPKGYFLVLLCYFIRNRSSLFNNIWSYETMFLPCRSKCARIVVTSVAEPWHWRVRIYCVKCCLASLIDYVNYIVNSTLDQVITLKKAIEALNVVFAS